MTPKIDAICLPLLLCVAGGLLSGCDRSTDERLAQFAERALREQAEQNARLAEQSQAIVAESHELAMAAKELVTHDAQARCELLSAHAELERERRLIAQQRYRDPLLAAVIQDIGLLVVCLLPLLVAALVVWQLHQQEPDQTAVAELLTLELTSEHPRLLPGPHSRQRALP